MLKALACVSLLTCFVSAANAAGKQAPSATPQTGGKAVPSDSTSAQSAPQSGAGITPSDYVIGPGDKLEVYVWRNPELSVNVPVRPDGKISTPLVDDMVAVGKTPVQLAHDIEAVLSEYVRDPKVNIIVTGAASVFSQVKVIGQVKKPSSIAYREGMTALDAVLEVGGLTDFAAGNRARLVRRDARGKITEIRVRLEDLLTKGRVKENVVLQPGDLLIVPESRF